MSLPEGCPGFLHCKDIPAKYEEGDQRTLYDKGFFGFIIRRDKAGTETRLPGAIKNCFETNPSCAIKRMYPNSEFREDDPNLPLRPTLGDPFAGLEGEFK